MSDDVRTQANRVFGRQSSPALGEDGQIMKTSVCDEIQQSILKADEIERQIANFTKVKKKNFSPLIKLLHVN